MLPSLNNGRLHYFFANRAADECWLERIANRYRPSDFFHIGRNRTMKIATTQTWTVSEAIFLSISHSSNLSSMPLRPSKFAPMFWLPRTPAMWIIPKLSTVRCRTAAPTLREKSFKEHQLVHNRPLSRPMDFFDIWRKSNRRRWPAITKPFNFPDLAVK
jgi:hypothetical protein